MCASWMRTENNILIIITLALTLNSHRWTSLTEQCSHNTWPSSTAQLFSTKLLLVWHVRGIMFVIFTSFYLSVSAPSTQCCSQQVCWHLHVSQLHGYHVYPTMPSRQTPALGNSSVTNGRQELPVWHCLKLVRDISDTLVSTVWTLVQTVGVWWLTTVSM